MAPAVPGPCGRFPHSRLLRRRCTNPFIRGPATSYSYLTLGDGDVEMGREKQKRPCMTEFPRLVTGGWCLAAKQPAGGRVLAESPTGWMQRYSGTSEQERRGRGARPRTSAPSPALCLVSLASLPRSGRVCTTHGLASTLAGRLQVCQASLRRYHRIVPSPYDTALLPDCCFLC
jgi:hypothetical protein